MEIKIEKLVKKLEKSLKKRYKGRLRKLRERRWMLGLVLKV